MPLPVTVEVGDTLLLALSLLSSVPVAHCVEAAQAEGDGLLLGLTLTVMLARPLPVEAGDREELAENLGVRVAQEEAVLLVLPGAQVALGQCVTLPLTVTLEVGLPLLLLQPLRVRVPVPVPEPETHTVALRLLEGQLLRLAPPPPDAVGFPVAEAHPVAAVLGLTEAEAESEGVREAVRLVEALPEPVHCVVELPPPEVLPDTLPVALALWLTELLTLAQAVSEEVWLTQEEVERLRVGLLEALGERLLLTVAEGEPLGRMLRLGVALALALLPGERVTEGDCVEDWEVVPLAQRLPVALVDGQRVGDRLPLGHWLPEGVRVGLRLPVGVKQGSREGLPVPVLLGKTVPLPLEVGQLVKLPPTLLPLGVLVRHRVGETVPQALTLPLRLPDTVPLLLPVSLASAVVLGEAETEAVKELLAVIEALSLRDADPLEDSETEEQGETVPVRLELPEVLGQAETLGQVEVVALTEAVRVPEPDLVALGRVVPLREELLQEEGEGVRVTEGVRLARVLLLGVPVEQRDGEGVPDREPVAVKHAVLLTVPLAAPEVLPERVVLTVEVGEVLEQAVREARRESEADTLGDAVTEAAAVVDGEALVAEEGLGDELELEAFEEEMESVALPHTVTLRVLLVVTDSCGLLLPVAECRGLALTLRESVCELQGESVAVALAVELPDGVPQLVLLLEAVRTEAVRLEVTEGEPLSVPPCKEGEAVPVLQWEPEPDTMELPLPLPLPLLLTVTLLHTLPLTVPVEAPLPLPLCVLLVQMVELGVTLLQRLVDTVALGHMEGAGEAVVQPVPVALCVLLPLSLTLPLLHAVEDTVPPPVPLALPQFVALWQRVGLPLAVSVLLTLGLPLAAPDTLHTSLALLLSVALPAPVLLGQREAVAHREGEALPVTLGVELPEWQAVLLGHAERLSVPEPVPLRVPSPLAVVLGEMEAEPLGQGEEEGVKAAVWLPAPLPELVMEAVERAEEEGEGVEPPVPLAHAVGMEVKEVVAELQAVAQEEWESEALPLPLPPGLLLPLTLPEPLLVLRPVLLSEAEPDSVPPRPTPEPVPLGHTVGVAHCVVDTVAQAVTLGQAEAVLQGLAGGVPEPVEDAWAEGEGEPELLWLAHSEADVLTLGLKETEGVRVCPPVPEPLKLPLPVEVDVPPCKLGLAVPQPVPERVPLALPLALPLKLALSVPREDAVAVGMMDPVVPPLPLPAGEGEAEEHRVVVTVPLEETEGDALALGSAERLVEGDEVRDTDGQADREAL